MKAEKTALKGNRIRSNPTNPPGNIAPDEIRAQLHRILEDSAFTKSPRLQAFLEYIVEETLAGRSKRIKGFSIGQAVFSSEETFDPETSNIVRVEAGRLRRRIAEYYLTKGQNDPISIDIPKGGYVPRFDRNEAQISEKETEIKDSEPKRSFGHFSSHRLVTAIGIVLVLLSLVITEWLFRVNERPIFSAGSKATPGQTVAPLSTSFIAVLPLTTLSGDPIEERLAAGLVETVITNIAKLSGLSVMAHASALKLDAESKNIRSIRQEFGATHALRGSLERVDSNIRVYIQLIDTASKATIWADRFDSTIEDLLDLQDIIADRIVHQLAVQIAPKEQKQLAHRHSNNAEALALYRQALVLIIPPDDMSRIVTARQMFLRVVELDPEFAGGYAGDAFSHAVTVLFLKAEDPEEELGQSIILALKAIEKDPDFGMGYAVLAFAYALSGRQEEALFNARRAVAIQQGDAFTQFVYGVSLTLSGSANEATVPLSKAIRLDPAEPRTPYRNVLGIAHYVSGEYAIAASVLEDNLNRGGPEGPHMDVIRAAVYAELGREQEAKSIINGLVESYPNYPVKRWLSKWIGADDGLSRIMDKLYSLGLPKHG